MLIKEPPTGKGIMRMVASALLVVIIGSTPVWADPPWANKLFENEKREEELSHDFGKKFDVAAVVAGDADGGDIFLDSGADNVADVAMKPKINDLDAVADEFEIDRVDGAVMSIANRNSSENANG